MYLSYDCTCPAHMTPEPKLVLPSFMQCICIPCYCPWYRVLVSKWEILCSLVTAIYCTFCTQFRDLCPVSDTVFLCNSKGILILPDGYIFLVSTCDLSLSSPSPGHENLRMFTAENRAVILPTHLNCSSHPALNRELHHVLKGNGALLQKIIGAHCLRLWTLKMTCFLTEEH